MDLIGIANQLHAGLEATVPSGLTVEQAREVMTVCFDASLSRDEGRWTRCSLLVPPVHVPQRPPHDNVEFDGEVRLTVETVRRLAPATDPRFGGLRLGVKNGQLVILGLFARRPPGWTTEGVEFQIRRPGALLVTRDEMEILQIAQGQPQWFGANEASLSWLIASMATTNEERAPRGLRARAETLTRVARRISFAGHGGSLFVVPRGAEVASLVGAPRYKIQRGSTLRTAQWSHLRTQRAVRGNTNSGAAMVARTRDQELDIAIATVASMALVDGALIVDTGLTVRSFGAFVEMGHQLPERVHLLTLHGQVMSGRDVRTEDLGGARHRSALAFCQSQPRWAIAFVVSQDGRGTAFVRFEDDGSLHAFRPIGFRWQAHSLHVP